MPDLRFTIKRHDRLPAIAIQAKYRDGTAVDLTGATTPKFYMRSTGAADSTTPDVDGIAEITDAANGKLRYLWGDGDTDVAGSYLAEFEVTLSGRRLSFPAAETLIVQVVGDLDGVDGAAPGVGFDEAVRDVIGATLVAGANVALAVDDDANTVTISATATGSSTAVGGDLTGTVGNAQIAAGAVGTTELAAGAVTIPKISAVGTPSDTVFLRGDGRWETPDGGNNPGGGGTSAAADISFSPTGTIAATNVQTAIAEVATDAAANLSAHDSDTTDIHGIADTSTLLTTASSLSGDVSGTLGATVIGAGVISTTMLADLAVIDTKIADGTISAAKLGSGAVGTTAIEDDAVTAAKIATGAVGSTEIAALAVTNAKIANGAIDADKIAAGAVDGSHIVAAAIGTSQLATDAVTADKIAANAVGSSEIAASAVGSSELADDAVTYAKIKDLAVGPGKITQYAVGTTELADGAVTVAKIDATGTPSGSTFLRGDGAWAAAGGGGGGSSVGGDLFLHGFMR